MNLKISVTFLAAIAAAIGVLAPAPQPDPLEAARHNNLGCAYMNQQLFEKGLKEFQQAQAADPKFTIARLNEGVAYLNLQKIDEAKAAFEDALKQDPKNPNAWYSLGLLAKNTGEAQAAVDALKHVAELDPNDADTWYFLGTAYVQAKQFPQAIEAFERALKINPLHASAEFGLSRAYQQSGNTDNAREHLKKFQYITQNKYGSPMSLAYGEQGQYSRAVESPQAQLKPPAQIKVQFVDVTKDAAIAFKDDSARKDLGGSGACFLDYDNDGKIDLFITDNGPQGGMTLYHNLGNGRFEDVTKQVGLGPNVHAQACTAGDYDNDGATDLAVSSGKVILLHNEKNGTFKDVTEAAGIATIAPPSGLTFVDYDHDGDLDLYTTSLLGPVSGPPTPGGLSAMWRNNGDGKFTQVTRETGLVAGPANGAVGTDYNNDRAVDLVVAGSTPGDPSLQSPLLYENPREGQFVRQDLIKATQSTNAVSVLDFDHDGWMDLTFTHSGSPALTLWRNNHGQSFG